MSDEETRARLAKVLLDAGHSLRFGPNGYALDTLMAEVDAIVNERAAEAVRQAFFDAAGQATGRGRRGPYVIADWLIDFGYDRALALRAAS